jgi:hypothetical protein
MTETKAFILQFVERSKQGELHLEVNKITEYGFGKLK